MSVAASLPLSALAVKRQAVTPRQTEGPFYPNRKQKDVDADLTLIEGKSERAAGEIIEVSGQVLAPDLSPIPDAVVDVWQANAYGRYAHEADSNSAPLDDNFQGWAVLKTDARGFYRFRSIMPGAYPVSARWTRPPHIHFKVSKPGFSGLTTQMYFAGHPLNEMDGILRQHPEAERKKLIVDFSRPSSSDAETSVQSGVFNIVLGPETSD